MKIVLFLILVTASLNAFATPIDCPDTFYGQKKAGQWEDKGDYGWGRFCSYKGSISRAQCTDRVFESNDGTTDGWCIRISKFPPTAIENKTFNYVDYRIAIQNPNKREAVTCTDPWGNHSLTKSTIGYKSGLDCEYSGTINDAECTKIGGRHESSFSDADFWCIKVEAWGYAKYFNNHPVRGVRMVIRGKF